MLLRNEASICLYLQKWPRYRVSAEHVEQCLAHMEENHRRLHVDVRETRAQSPTIADLVSTQRLVKRKAKKSGRGRRKEAVLEKPKVSV